MAFVPERDRLAGQTCRPDLQTRCGVVVFSLALARWILSGVFAATVATAVAAPVARRFGSMVIERNLECAIGGQVNLAFLVAGVQCDILIPPEHLVGLIDGRTA